MDKPGDNGVERKNRSYSDVLVYWRGLIFLVIPRGIEPRFPA